MEDVPIRLAICDDHPVFRSGIRGLVAESPGFEFVFEVGSLEALTTSLRDARIDVLLLDIGLPDGSGVDALPALAAETRVLVISAFSDARTVRRALTRGATGFLRKDEPPDGVVRAIRRVAKGQTVVSADVAIELADAVRTDSESLDFRRRVVALTPRQRDVLDRLAQGFSNREIARALSVSEGTVKNHMTVIMESLGVGDRTRLAVLITRYGLDG